VVNPCCFSLTWVCLFSYHTYMSLALTRATTQLPKATKRDARLRNLRTILQALYSGQATTRADLARATGLTRAAVSSLVGELIDETLITEGGTAVGPQGGKPATILTVNDNARTIVVIDLGHRPIRGALLDLAGTVVHRDVSGNGRPSVDDVIALASRLIAAAAAPILGIGIGTPGVVDGTGTVVEASNLDWHDVPLADLVGRALGYPTVVTNDAHAAALGELRLLERDATNLLLVELGEGVGAGLVLDSAIHRGQHSAAGELGHVVVDPGGPRCRCGNQGCLETLASVPAIIRHAAQTAAAQAAAAGKAAAEIDPETVAWTRAALAAVAGTEATDQAIDRAGRHLGAALAHVVGILDITRIVVTAELEGADDILVAAVEQELRSRLLHSTAEHVTVEVSRLGPDLVLAGAGAAVLADQLGVVLR